MPDHASRRRRGFPRFVPDLAVEVDSPRQLAQDLQQKIQDYLAAGVRLLWVVHVPARSATVYHPDGSARLLRDAEALDGEEVLPGLAIPLGAISWAEFVTPVAGDQGR